MGIQYDKRLTAVYDCYTQAPTAPATYCSTGTHGWCPVTWMVSDQYTPVECVISHVLWSEYITVGEVVLYRMYRALWDYNVLMNITPSVISVQ